MVTPKVLLFMTLAVSMISCDKVDGEVFKSDIGEQMQIGISDEGYKHVKLRCGADEMVIDLETEEEFDGVIYTRGSFYDRQPPCFLAPERKARNFKLHVPLDKCNTKKDGELYNNVLILQYDKELIMPGDAAFNLECDFSKPREVTVNANLKQNVISRISLTDADPVYQNSKRFKRTVENYTDNVILTPIFMQLQQQRKTEL